MSDAYKLKGVSVFAVTYESEVFEDDMPIKPVLYQCSKVGFYE